MKHGHYVPCKTCLLVSQYTQYSFALFRYSCVTEHIFFIKKLTLCNFLLSLVIVPISISHLSFKNKGFAK